MPTLDLPERHLDQLRRLLKTHVPDAEVWAYGSRVNGQSHEASDLDLVLRNPTDLSRPQEHLHDLKGALSDSNIPILVDVLDWARLPEHFHAMIEDRYVAVQEGRKLPKQSGRLCNQRVMSGKNKYSANPYPTNSSG